MNINYYYCSIILGWRYRMHLECFLKRIFSNLTSIKLWYRKGAILIKVHYCEV